MTDCIASGLLRGIVLVAVGLARADAQVPATPTGLKTQEDKKGNERVAEHLRKESDAFKKEREARFAKLREIGNEESRRSVLLKNWLVQMRPMLKVEYLFMRTVCQPSKEERKPIAHAGELALREAVGSFVDYQVQGSSAKGPPADYRKIVQDGLLAAVKATLSDDLYRRYRQELEIRAEEQKQGAVMRLVAKMDATLLLTSDQREKIKAVLLDQWDSHLSRNAAYFNLEFANFPMIPDQDFLPVLSDAQKLAWVGAPKVQLHANPYQAFAVAPGPLDDEFPDEVIEVAAATKWLPADGGKPSAKIVDELNKSGVTR